MKSAIQIVKHLDARPDAKASRLTTAKLNAVSLIAL
jgi:hypothetical protein